MNDGIKCLEIIREYEIKKHALAEEFIDALGSIIEEYYKDEYSSVMRDAARYVDSEALMEELYMDY